MKNSAILPLGVLMLMLSGCASTNSVPDSSSFAPPGKITAPRPIAGNGGKYMCPFTANGTVAAWAKVRYVETDNGSDIAANVGGAVGKQAADKALDFVPFGLGGMIGQHAGEAAGRAATSKNIDNALPSMGTVKASSDISFNSVDKLAIYMYAKHSAHKEYARILELAGRIYPELQQEYVSAIEKASRAPRTAGQQRTTAQEQSTKPEAKRARVQKELVELQALKNKGAITDAEFTSRRDKLLDTL